MHLTASRHVAQLELHGRQVLVKLLSQVPLGQVVTHEFVVVEKSSKLALQLVQEVEFPAVHVLQLE